MENKYYTPTIEEFHVGFECEVATISSNGNENWSKELIGPTWFNSIGQNNIKESIIELGTYRVKYLDKEDIESLGFEVKWNEYGNVVLEKGKYRIFYNTRFETDKVTIVDKVDDETPFTDCPVLFTGIIKNKSKLKRILKMIGYEN